MSSAAILGDALRVNMNSELQSNSRQHITPVKGYSVDILILHHNNSCNTYNISTIHIEGNEITFRGGNCQSCFCLLCEKDSTLKGKNLLPPLGANSFLSE